MSFISDTHKGTTYAPGYFIANGDEDIIRETRGISASSASVKTTDDGGKYVPAGTAYPTNDASAIGLLYEGVDVTDGDMPGSVITGKATVYEDRLSVALDSAAKTALEAKGFTFITSAPAVTRPY